MIIFVVFFVIFYGYIKKIDVYNSFIEGAKESFTVCLNMFPSLLAMMFAINIFISSNILDMIPFNDIISMIILRPLSASSSLSILDNILKTHGPDSFTGVLASTLQGSCDTTFYIIALYLGSIGIKNYSYAFKACLIADIIGITASIFIVKLFF